ncbi:Ggt Gamma-glutamyltransferase [Rhabdaerophilaceae bacterium]
MAAATPIARATAFTLEKQPATGSRGMVVTNHPLASGAGAQMLLAGGNAIDGAVAALFALSVVEPMMVGVLGGGVTHIRLADGNHTVIDGLSTAPALAKPEMYEPLSDGLPSSRETVGRKNVLGALAIGVPGALAGWCHALQTYGTMSLAEVMEPAIQLAEAGFMVTPYLSDCISDAADNLTTDPGLSALFLSDGRPLQTGVRLVQADYGRTLRLIAAEGPSVLYGGVLGHHVAAHIGTRGGILALDDLADYRPIERAPIKGSYRGYDIFGPPPPASAGVHIAQMLHILEGFDLARMGFGSPKAMHLIAEVLKIAFADRAVATADPAFVTVPVERLISRSYAAERRAQLDLARAKSWSAGVSGQESANTTHVTVADDKGNVVAATQTINDVFGASVQIAGTGMIANNYMLNFDPHPGRALSIAPGKRVFTSMAPMMAGRDGQIHFALGLPGGLRIFPSAMQAIINVIDHGMSPQEAVEAPRIWTEGGVLELEPAYSSETAAALEARGHRIARVNRIAGGMSMVSVAENGTLTGAACWRADGTPVGLAGGLARAGVRFSI